MCAVEQPFVLVVPLPAQQADEDRVVLDVGDACQDLAAIAHPSRQPRQNGPGINHVFEHVAEDQAVDAWLGIG